MDSILNGRLFRLARGRIRMASAFHGLLGFITPSTFLGRVLLMRFATIFGAWVGLGWLLAVSTPVGVAEDPPRAFIDGTGPGWKTLGAEDFTRANCDPETFTWKGADVYCSGVPVGVLRSAKTYANFELVARWRHLKSGGN